MHFTLKNIEKFFLTNSVKRLKGMANGGVNIRRSSQPTGAPVTRVMRQAASKVAVGVREMLISLGLLCLLSLLMGLLALVFLLKMSPPPDPYNFDQVRPRAHIFYFLLLLFRC